MPFTPEPFFKKNNKAVEIDKDGVGGKAKPGGRGRVLKEEANKDGALSAADMTAPTSIKFEEGRIESGNAVRGDSIAEAVLGNSCSDLDSKAPYSAPFSGYLDAKCRHWDLPTSCIAKSLPYMLRNKTVIVFMTFIVSLCFIQRFTSCFVVDIDLANGMGHYNQGWKVSVAQLKNITVDNVS